VLIVNNYRDAEDDASVGKRTTVVIFGRKVMGTCYLLSGLLAMLLMMPVWVKLGLYSLAVPAVYIAQHVATWRKVVASRGAALNPLLGRSAVNLLVFALLLLVAAALG
jgi:1,4-dihydroxy-2-naphthoate octaprenyltransferase